MILSFWGGIWTIKLTAAKASDASCPPKNAPVGKWTFFHLGGGKKRDDAVDRDGGLGVLWHGNF